jgi:hypothetical protein
MVLADVFAHQSFRKSQNMADSPPSPRRPPRPSQISTLRPTLGRTDSPPSAPEPDSPSSVYRDVSRGPSPESRSGR